MKSFIEFYGTLLKTSIRASMSRRAAALLEAFLMMANYIIFFSLWWIFFKKVQTVGNWTVTDMSILMCICMAGYGLMQIVCGGTRKLARTITSGELDVYLSQPKPVLLHICGSRSAVKGWGNIASTIALI